MGLFGHPMLSNQDIAKKLNISPGAVSQRKAKIHAAGRRRGQGNSSGPFSGSVTVWLLRMLEMAHDDPG